MNKMENLDAELDALLDSVELENDQNEKESSTHEERVELLKEVHNKVVRSADVAGAGKDMGCNGGLMDNAFDWATKNGGVCVENGYPYTSEKATAESNRDSRLKNGECQCGMQQCRNTADQMCSKCKTMIYCSRNCQTLHWTAHKVECKYWCTNLLNLTVQQAGTKLCAFAIGGQVEVVRFFLEYYWYKGAKTLRKIINFKFRPQFFIPSMPGPGPLKVTPLVLATYHGHAEIVSLLLDYGVKSDLKLHGATAITIAAQAGHTTIAAALIDAGVNVDIGIENGITPLFLAAQHNNLSVAKKLIDAGACMDTSAAFKLSPLIKAIQKGSTAIAKLLIDRGCNVEQVDCYGFTPLILAAETGDLDTVMHLVQTGAALDTQDEDGCTALLRAVVNRHTTAALYLIRKGANVALKSNHGDTVAKVASRMGLTSIADECIRKIFAILNNA